MNELENLLEIVKKSKRYAAHGVIAAIVTCLAGWYYVTQIPDQYTSFARIYVDPESILDSLLEGIAVDSARADQEFTSFAYSRITSRESIKQLIRVMDKDLLARNDSDMSKLADQVRENLVLDLQSEGRQQRAKFLSITYTAESPVNAQRVVGEAVNIFLESAIGSSATDSSDSVDFLERQIADYETRLREAEDELEEFRRKNLGMVPGESGGFFTQLQRVNTNIQDTELGLREAEQRIAQIRKSLSEGSDGTDVTLTLQRIANLQDRLDGLLLQFTESHPDVISTRQQLDRLKEQNRELISGGALVSDVARSNQAMELSKAEGEAATLRTRLEEYQRRKADLTAVAETVPRIETELTRLSRNYELFKERRDALVQRREAALLAVEAGRRQSNSKFQVIEPPLLPSAPSNTPEALLHTGVLILGIGVGLAAALALTVLRPTFGSVKELGRAVDLPVLGSVSLEAGAATSNRSMIYAAVVITLTIYVFIGIVPLIADLLG